MSGRFVLASASPRRRELLAGLGLDFEVRPVDLDETPQPGESPAACVLRLAESKARARLGDGEIVLAADTIVVIDGRILGKPSDAEEARAMLATLAGRTHEVFTGVALACGDRPPRLAVALDRTLVSVVPLDAAAIDAYVATGEPLDKAGAYAIQGIGALLVARIEGNYTNVVGLPLPTVARLARELGLGLFDLPALGLSRRT